jgi:hypothetical protein
MRADLLFVAVLAVGCVSLSTMYTLSSPRASASSEAAAARPGLVTQQQSMPVPASSPLQASPPPRAPQSDDTAALWRRLVAVEGLLAASFRNQSALRVEFLKLKVQLQVRLPPLSLSLSLSVRLPPLSLALSLSLSLSPVTSICLLFRI